MSQVPVPPSDEELRHQKLVRSAPAMARWMLLMAAICFAFTVALLVGLLGGSYDGQVNYARWFGVGLLPAAGVFFLWGWSKVRRGPVYRKTDASR
ncbi:hypothetical protein [Oerskovia flava]|uniref:hypothetical protein n=1 Tax=Oerskovia flava TaxID=2986422 RepID=UPI0022407E86|nr:hypothetical protein [Oerskovia sp. JB1-3-2]